MHVRISTSACVCVCVCVGSECVSVVERESVCGDQRKEGRGREGACERERGK